MRRATHPTGFTLVELCIVMTVAGLLLTVAWPSYRAQLLRGQRADAVAALQRVQLAQESHRAFHGLYAAQLEAEADKAKAERADLYNVIRTALSNAHNADELKAAWLLTQGKKQKLGDSFELLETLKDSRKSEILAEVA